MKAILCVCLLLVSAIEAYPYNNAYNGYRVLPQRSVMFGGYYGQPLNRRSYIPQGSMSTILSGDTVATNSFAGEEFVPENEAVETQEEITEKYKPVQEEVPLEAEEETVVEVSTVKAKRVPKRKLPKPQNDEEEDGEDSSGGWPFKSGKGMPSYNAFFPIMIGGGGGFSSKSRSGGEEGSYPGSATAIANSFSTGKGGVASSHATAFGDPYMAALFRSGMFARSKPKQSKE